MQTISTYNYNDACCHAPYESISLRVPLFPFFTIPGISYITAGRILGEMTGFNVHEQSDPRALLAFAGLDPSLKQSGIMKGTSKMSKRGSHFLRQAIWQASLCASSIDPMFKRIYEKQKGKGKHHNVRLSHVAKS